jgi:hypothetical protein
VQVFLQPGQVTDRDWHVIGAADMNTDGHVDLIWPAIC